MKINRRSFLKTLLGGAAVTTSTIILANGAKNGLIPGSTTKITADSCTKTPDDPNKHWGFLIDLSKCNGCIDQTSPEDDPTGELPLCTHSCRMHHKYLKANPPQYWIRVYQPYNFPKPCQNCGDPPCLRVCPTGATYKRQDGTVLINDDICIGCRICMAACPYETRFFWWEEPADEGEVTCPSPEFAAKHTRGTVSKCDYCVDNAYNGLLPNCVSACPRGVLYYGDLNEDAVSNPFETISLSKTLEKYGGYRYKELTLDVNHSIMYENTLYIRLTAHSSGDSKPLQNKDVSFIVDSPNGLKTIAQGKTDNNGIFDFNFKNKYNKNEISIIAELKDEAQIKPSRVAVNHV